MLSNKFQIGGFVMGQEEKQWHQRFLRYMDYIVNNPNYQGLPIKKKPDGSYAWIATAKSEIGQQRIDWCIDKAQELDYVVRHEAYPGMYADVMLEIHPTKWKVCQICGKSMSLYYHYPNANFLKSLNKKFGTDFSDCDHISDIWDELINQGVRKNTIATFLINKGDLDLDPRVSEKDEIIDALEYTCRKGEKKCLGPGAMSNFPDRYDGFHTYNRCCRATQDKGRSKENLRSYTKDRRAYEYWSDGNIHAANQFMGSNFFDGTSADHIGPISLGFVHDPRYLQPMSGGDNSSKRDRLQIKDIESIIETEQRTGVYPMSWYSKLIWEYIKTNYSDNSDKVPTVYRDALKQNMANFMFVLLTILETCPKNGEDFLVSAFLEPNYGYFKYSYSFNENGEIIVKIDRHYTDRNQYETDRYRRIAIEAVYDYNEKDNRNNKPDLNLSELSTLKAICSSIESNDSLTKNKQLVINLVETIEKRIIRSL